LETKACRAGFLDGRIPIQLLDDRNFLDQGQHITVVIEFDVVHV
jgi:hypothetical protein